MGFVEELVVFFLLMVWVGLGSVVVVFGWVISVAIVLRVCRLYGVDDMPRGQLALVSRCVVLVGEGHLLVCSGIQWCRNFDVLDLRCLLEVVSSYVFYGAF